MYIGSWREGRGDQEHAVGTVERGAQAGRVAQAGVHGLARTALKRDVLLARLVHHRAHVDAVTHQGRHDQPGELAGRPGREDLHRRAPVKRSARVPGCDIVISW
jgi:hypothetical protein